MERLLEKMRELAKAANRKEPVSGKGVGRVVRISGGLAALGRMFAQEVGKLRA